MKLNQPGLQETHRIVTRGENRLAGIIKEVRKIKEPLIVNGNWIDEPVDCRGKWLIIPGKQVRLEEDLKK